LAGVAYTVIIPATDRPETLDNCIEAILAAADPPEQVIVIEKPAGLGPAGARNRGAEHAKGSVLVFVDSDVAVHPDAFTRIRSAFELDPTLSAVFGSYDDRPSAHGVVSTFRNMLHHYVHHSSAGRASTFWAGLGAVRREAFFEADGFDERRFESPSVEDIELGLRLAAAGHRIQLDPTIQGTHLKRWRLRTMLLTDLLHRGRPWTALVLDRGPRAARLNLRGKHGVAAVAFTLGLAALLVGRPRVAAPLAAAYLAINMRFYGLMLRQAGPGAAAAAVGLLAAHNAAALGSAPLGVLSFAAERTRPPEPGQRRLADRSPAGEVPPALAADGAPAP
jgi:GT2 family glycosyltransferase